MAMGKMIAFKSKRTVNALNKVLFNKKKKPKVSKAIQKYVKDEIKVETGISLPTVPIALLTSAHSTSPFTFIDSAQSNDCYKHLEVVFRFKLEPGTVSSTRDFVRFLLIYDNDVTGGVAPAVTDILESAVPESQYAVGIRDQPYKPTPYRFKILQDKTFKVCSLVSSGGTGNPSNMHMINIRQSLKHIPKMGPDDMTLTGITDKGLFYVLLGSYASGASASLVTGSHYIVSQLPTKV